MATRKKSKPLPRGFVMFDVLYEDGSRSSNRRIPAEIVQSYEGEKAVLAMIEEQDEAIAERSGKPRLPIKQLTRSRV